MHTLYKTHSTNEADTRTHPSFNFHLPHLTTKDVTHARELLGVFCARVCDWGLSTFDAESPEARLLRALRSLYIVIHSDSARQHAEKKKITTVAVVTDYGTLAYEMETDHTEVLRLTSEVMCLKDRVSGFRLSFEVGYNIYDVTQVTECLQSAAFAQLLRVNVNPEPYR